MALACGGPLDMRLARSAFDTNVHILMIPGALLEIYSSFSMRSGRRPRTALQRQVPRT